jgi:hypothetical protein
MATKISKKRKFVADGVLYAEVNELLNRELADAGYAGVEIRNAPMKTEIIIRAAEPLKVAGEKARRIRELTSVVQKRFKFAEGAVELFAERVANKGLSAQAQVELLEGVLAEQERKHGEARAGAARAAEEKAELARAEHLEAISAAEQASAELRFQCEELKHELEQRVQAAVERSALACEELRLELQLVTGSMVLSSCLVVRCC